MGRARPAAAAPTDRSANHPARCINIRDRLSDDLVVKPPCHLTTSAPTANLQLGCFVCQFGRLFGRPLEDTGPDLTR